MDDGAVSQDRRFRRSSFEETDTVDLNLTSTRAMLVEVSKASEHRHGALWVLADARRREFPDGKRGQ